MYLGSLSLSQLKEQAYNLPEINRNTQLGKQGLINIPPWSTKSIEYQHWETRDA